jgi:hypothetical protein
MRPSLSLLVIASRGQAIQNCSKTLNCFVAFTPSRKRFAFVAGNDWLS